MHLLRKIFERKTRQQPWEARRRARISVEPGEFAAIYAIGDVHGRYDLLLDAEQRIRGDALQYDEKVLLVYLGDYVDRGPSSRHVLQHFCVNHYDTIERIVLCGNHEEALLNMLNAPSNMAEWLRFAGTETLGSYGIDVPSTLRQGGARALASALHAAMPEQHKRLLEAMPVLIQADDLIFVHAGIRTGIPLDLQTDDDLLWIREPFLSKGPRLPIMVIHGHTPNQKPDIGNGRIGIDTGAYATGNLTVLKIADGAFNFLSFST